MKLGFRQVGLDASTIEGQHHPTSCDPHGETSHAAEIRDPREAESISTATITTALFKRGLRNQMIQDVVPARSGQADDGRRSLHAALHSSA